jgi:hypothetical protein
MMQIVVQEGEASVSLTTTIQAPDDTLRTSSLNILTGAVKVFYRDFEVIRIEARAGALELTPTAVASITWLRKDRRYQLKLSE